MAIQKHFSTRDQGPVKGSLDAAGPRRAVFLDRDGTLIEEREYLSEPDEIALIPGAAAALTKLRAAGFALVVVTNQSAVGRGWLTKTKLDEIHTELERLLDEAGVTLDALYSCPDVAPEPSAGARTAPDHPLADRKPGAGMLVRAAEELDLRLGESWMVGDHARDLAAGSNAGCRGNILVLTGHGPQFRADVSSEDSTCRDLDDAAELILREYSLSPTP